MSTPTDNNLNNHAAPLRRTSNGPVKVGSHLAADTGNYSVPSIVPVAVKQTDYKNLKTGEDFRGQAQGGTDPLKDNDGAPRAETNDQLEGVGG